MPIPADLILAFLLGTSFGVCMSSSLSNDEIAFPTHIVRLRDALLSYALKEVYGNSADYPTETFKLPPFQSDRPHTFFDYMSRCNIQSFIAKMFVFNHIHSYSSAVYFFKKFVDKVENKNAAATENVNKNTTTNTEDKSTQTTSELFPSPSITFSEEDEWLTT